MSILNESVQYIQSKKNVKPKVGIVLGSGLGEFVNRMEDKTIIPYSEIPHFKKVSVKGHDGQLIIGSIHGVSVVAMQGRFHFYEGHQLSEVVYPIRVLKALGIDTLFLTNAAGGVNLSYQAGDLMLITDHINLTGHNPLIGPNDEKIGPRFPDMTHAYDSQLLKLVDECARTHRIPIQKGVYTGVLGPSYETPAEINMIRILGGDAVGMSTVPESIVANHIGLKVCGISCITNMGAGVFDRKLNHDDIKEEAMKSMENFTNLLTHTIKKLK